jgi:hypothetical protein
LTTYHREKLGEGGTEMIGSDVEAKLVEQLTSDTEFEGLDH